MCENISIINVVCCLMVSKHAKPTDRLGRRYRDLDTNVFSIADEDDNG